MHMSAPYHLDIFVADPAALPLYDASISAHNESVGKRHPDSGFDLFTPCATYGDLLEAGTVGCKAGVVLTVCANLGVKIAMRKADGTPVGCYLYARSSCAKYPFRLGNNQGIIDSGYRGDLKAMLDVDWRLASFRAPHTNCIPSVEECMRNSREFEARDMVPDGQLSLGRSNLLRLTQLCAPGLEPFTVSRVESPDMLGETERGSGGIGSTGY